jgi:Bacterial SH3 domain
LTSNGGKVNIRKSPDVSASVIYQLNKGEEVVYLGEKTQFMTSVVVNGVERNNFWFKVQAMENADAVGWVHGDFVNFPGNSAPEKKNRKYTKNDLIGNWWTPHFAVRKITFYSDDKFLFEDGKGNKFKGIYEYQNNTVKVLNDEFQVRLEMSGGGEHSFVLTGDGENFVKEWDDNHR